MKKFSFILGVFSIAMLLVSCDKEDGKGIDTSKAIRSGNFLQAANFEDLSVLNIKNQGNVKSSFKDKVATFEYSKSDVKNKTKSTASPFPTTEISFLEPVLVEITPGSYTLSFEYYFDTEDDSEIRQAMQNIMLLLEFTPVPLTEDVIPTEVMPIEIGTGGRDERMKKEWTKYEKKAGHTRSEFCHLQFTLKNISKVDNNILHIRNITYVKD